VEPLLPITLRKFGDNSLMGTIVLLDLMGGVALLLWGVHMVQSGILHAFGPELRRFLSTALQNRLAAFDAGVGLTASRPHPCAPRSETH
jgi:hypothetical protein